MNYNVNSTKHSYLTLDGMRGIAAIIVVFQHIHPNFLPYNPFASGYLAVDLFFLMSGFVIAYAYEDKLLSGMGLWQFILRRIIRLYPLFLAVGLISVSELLVRMKGHPELRPQLVPFIFNLFYLPMNVPGAQPPQLYPLNYVAWSLGLELLVNFAYGAFIKPLHNRVVLSVVIAAGAGALLMSAAVYKSLDLGVIWHTVPGGLARVTFSFAAGIALYRLTRLRPFNFPWFVSLFCLVAVILICLPNPSPAWRPFYDLFAVLLVIPVIVFLAVCSAPPAVFRKIDSLLGDASYPLYVIQLPAIMMALHVITVLKLSASWYLTGGLIVGLLTASLAAHFLYDLPVRKFLLLKLKSAARSQ